MLISSICSRVAFVQRETLLTEPVVAPERDRKGKREREDQLDVSESSFLTFPVYCIFGVVLESVNTIQVQVLQLCSHCLCDLLNGSVEISDHTLPAKCLE